MTSLLTNNAAVAALATLRAVSVNLTKTQDQVSSGLRVSQASDNAAYWSISTTMKSDAGAISAVSDALGLGAAKADVAYEGLNSTIDVLDQFKDKLVTANEGSVDRKKIQTEMDQLKQQLQSIASSSSFNGENWLSTDIDDIEDPAQTKASVVSSFVRSSSGSSISVNTTDIDLWGISLFNSSGNGSLQADNRSPGTIGGLRNTDQLGNGGTAAQFFTFSGPLVFTDNSTAITFQMTVDADDPSITSNPGPGTTSTVTVDRSVVDAVYPGLNGVVSTAYEFSRVLQSVTLPLGVGVPTQSSDPSKYSLWTNETNGNTGSSMYIFDVNSTLADGSTAGLTNSTAISYGSRPTILTVFDKAFHISDSAKIYVPITVDGSTTTLEIDKDFVDQTLGTSTGEVTSAMDFAQILNAAMIDQNVGVAATGSGNFIQFSIDEIAHKEAGSKSQLGVGPASDNLGVLADFGIMDVDVTSSDADIDHYLYGVEGMIKKVTAAASKVGSLQSRIAAQSDFALALSDSITSGIGKLVDADMEDESAKLSAQQTQQQLAVQSLSIANSSTQSLLSLFR